MKANSRIINFKHQLFLRTRGWPIAFKLWAAYHLLAKPNSYLLRSGWVASFRSNRPINATGAPIPWLTLSAIHFLTDRLKPTMHVFEYGSGNSTHWLSQRVAHVTSCEHDRAWYDQLKPQLPANVNYLFRNLDDGYADTIIETEGKFDVVVIDGRKRVECCKNALTALTNNGVIIFDNADREKYLAGLELMAQYGFKRIDFTGLAPSNTIPATTAILYRPQNCLDI